MSDKTKAELATEEADRALGYVVRGILAGVEKRPSGQPRMGVAFPIRTPEGGSHVSLKLSELEMLEGGDPARLVDAKLRILDAIIENQKAKTE